MRPGHDPCTPPSSPTPAPKTWGPPVIRPPFWRGLMERGWGYREAGAALGCSGEFVRLICLPFSDRRRVKPGKDIAERILTFSEGEIPPESFEAPPTPDQRVGA